MKQREIIGTAVSITDYDEVLAAIDAAIAEDRRIFICCTPASSLVFARDDGALAEALAAADIVTPDGMGVVHAARLLGEQIGDRVYGPDLMQLHMDREPAPAYLFGGHDDATLEQLVGSLKASHPKLEIAGAWSPPHRELTEDELGAALDSINASGAKVVWVGLGSPKQERWMFENRAALDAPVLIGVGAAFDFFAGRVAQAPRWMQRAGLEWLFRVFQDPVRLGRRYLLTLPRFAALVLAQRLRGRAVR